MSEAPAASPISLPSSLAMVGDAHSLALRAEVDADISLPPDLVADEESDGEESGEEAEVGAVALCEAVGTMTLPIDGRRSVRVKKVSPSILFPSLKEDGVHSSVRRDHSPFGDTELLDIFNRINTAKDGSGIVTKAELVEHCASKNIVWSVMMDALGASKSRDVRSYMARSIMHDGVLRRENPNPLSADATELELEEEAVTFNKRVLHENHQDIGTSMGTLATSYNNVGRHAEALALNKEMLVFYKRVLPEGHPQHVSIATIMNNTAVTYSALGEYDEALKLNEDALAFRKRLLPEDHPDIGQSMNNLAANYNNLQRYEESLKLQEETLEFQIRVIPDDHLLIASTMGNLAASYTRIGHYDEALQLQEEKLASQKLLLSPDHLEIAASLNNTALTLNYLERYEDAERTLKAALLILMKKLQAGHPRLMSCKKTLAKLRVKINAGAGKAAVKRRKEAVSALKADGALTRILLPGDEEEEEEQADVAVVKHVPQETAAQMTNRANAHIKGGRYNLALKLHEEALAFTQETMPEDHPDVAQSMSNLATSLYYHKRYDESEHLLMNTLKILKQNFPPTHQDIRTCEGSLKNLRIAANKPKPGAPGAKAVKKQKPNAKCACGSDKKYKKCCGKL